MGDNVQFFDFWLGHKLLVMDTLGAAAQYNGRQWLIPQGVV